MLIYFFSKDCAYIYGNEKQVGIGLKEGMNELGLTRDDIWVTGKLWNTFHRPDLLQSSLKKTINDLDLEYLDLYLLHWPVEELPADTPKIGGDPSVIGTPLWETFTTMNDLLNEGLIKTIGVCNFGVQELEELIKDTDLVPSINQIEIHPYLTQLKLIDYCKSKGIEITAYSPLGSGGKPKKPDLPPLLSHPTLIKIGSDHGKSPAQIAIRWSLQHGFIVIPKTSNIQRLDENINVFDFELSQIEMDSLDQLNKNFRFVAPSFYNFPNS